MLAGGTVSVRVCVCVRVYGGAAGMRCLAGLRATHSDRLEAGAALAASPLSLPLLCAPLAPSFSRQDETGQARARHPKKMRATWQPARDTNSTTPSSSTASLRLHALLFRIRRHSQAEANTVRAHCSTHTAHPSPAATLSPPSLHSAFDAVVSTSPSNNTRPQKRRSSGSGHHTSYNNKRRGSSSSSSGER